ncbi:MAG: arginine--tRNA ligase [Erysipelotrichaceae bacterium]|nr:arginine--tRNA ligase [Erysipelotrichaceae bacterium]
MSVIETNLIKSIETAVQKLYDQTLAEGMIMIEIPKDPSNGDYSTNIAMRLTKLLKKNPQIIAQEIKAELEASCPDVKEVTVAGPGFINFRMKATSLANIINTVIEQNEKYGHNDSGKGEKILLEYVSANPTGNLHCGHARGAAWGDSTARLLKASGYDVLREYYINDAGNQMRNLGLSVYARYAQLFGKEVELPADGYYGEDVIQIAKLIKEEHGDEWLEREEGRLHFFIQEGYRLELVKLKRDLDLYRVAFDSWISEQSLYDTGRVDKAIEELVAQGLTYEEDGALWLKTVEYGDDKNRVLRKNDGALTYLTPDIANHVYKFERGYTKLVNIWGADHHGYIPRMKAALTALGHPKDSLEVDIVQMVRLVENGEEVKMSKRTGNAVTIRDLCEDIGVDATRYFFVSRALDTHLDFDLSLARKQTNENPVYYAQYAHARICSILRQAPEFKALESYDLLVEEKETALLKYINEFVSVVSDAAATRSPNKICNYIQKLASLFHSFYGAHKIIDPENEALTNQRLGLLLATKITLANALDFIGITAPEKM